MPRQSGAKHAPQPSKAKAFRYQRKTFSSFSGRRRQSAVRHDRIRLEGAGGASGGPLPVPHARQPALHVYQVSNGDPVRIKGRLASVVEKYPNEEQDTSKFRRYFWQQVFHRRARACLDRAHRKGGRRHCRDLADRSGLGDDFPARRPALLFMGRREYPAADIIDIPFMMARNGVMHSGADCHG